MPPHPTPSQLRRELASHLLSNPHPTILFDYLLHRGPRAVAIWREIMSSYFRELEQELWFLRGAAQEVYVGAREIEDTVVQAQERVDALKAFVDAVERRLRMYEASQERREEFRRALEGDVGW